MIRAVIFDMDGVLIDSEPLWKKAEQKVFSTVGLQLTDEMCRKTTGLDNMSTVRFWHSHQPWKNKTIEEVAEEINVEVTSLLLSQVVVKEYVNETIDFFKSRKMPLGVASSSGIKIINAVLEKLKLKDKFAAVYSSEYEEFGKPHPGVYLTAAKLLNVKPEQCLAFEDSFFGALAARSARMKVVSVLDKADFEDTRFDFTDLKITSFRNFTKKEFEHINLIL